MPKQFKPQVTIQEEMNINRRTISEIKNIMWDSDNEETIFTCQGKIINIDIDNSGWYFIFCEICRKKVKSRDKFLWCDNCNKKACFPIPRYRIQSKVEDSSGMATFILFDSEAEKLLNISAKDLLNKSLEEPDEVILPVQIENLKGKQFVFQIQLNDYNLNYGWELYTVKKLFDSFQETDKTIQLDKMTEVYISDTSNECSNNLSIEEDGDCTKIQKLDVQSNVQLTPTSVLKENKRAYSGTTTKQQRKKIQKTL
ncbi:replication protein A 70 kDa DNA-binding subunit B [Quercus suber]|uniref:Replication protein a 70 kDa dna-binding subunit d n=1 Tax=Quercus suber TaxID=58331 RepID=A0AAW0LFE8_QUESU